MGRGVEGGRGLFSDSWQFSFPIAGKRLSGVKSACPNNLGISMMVKVKRFFPFSDLED